MNNKSPRYQILIILLLFSLALNIVMFLYIIQGNFLPLPARAGQIAHINRIMPHTWDKKNTGIRYCTLTVRHGPVSA